MRGISTLAFGIGIIGFILALAAIGQSDLQGATIVSADSLFTKLIENKAYVTWGYAIFEFYNPYEEPLPADRMGFDFIVPKDSTGIKGTETYVLVNEPLYTTEYNKVKVEKECIGEPNATFVGGAYDCSYYNTVENQVVTYRDVWKDISGFVFQPKHAYKIKFIARWKAQLGYNSREWIPKINIPKVVSKESMDKEYTQTKWAWWDSDYSYKQLINITNNNATTAMPAGFAVGVEVDTETLVNAGKMLSSCFDLRIVDETADAERARVNESLCNTTTTHIFFNITSSIAAGSYNDTSYYMYYGYGGAGDPGYTRDQVYIIYDDFTDGSFADSSPHNWTFRVGDTAEAIIMDCGGAYGNCLALARQDGGDATGLMTPVGDHDNLMTIFDVRMNWTNAIQQANTEFLASSTVRYTSLYWAKNDGTEEYDYYRGPFAALILDADWDGDSSWHRLNITVLGDVFSLYWDDTLKGTPVVDSTSDDYDHVGLSAHGTAGYFNSFDNVKVMHYILPAPTISLGTEEAAPAGNASDRLLTITIDAPTNTTYSNTNVSLNFVGNDTMSPCYYEFGGSNTTLASCSNTTFLANAGSNTVKVWANSSTGNWSSASTSFTISYYSLLLSMTKPANTTYNGTIPIEFTALPLGGFSADTCYYELDGVNNTMSCTNTSISATDGTHYLKLWANNSIGMWNSTSLVYFTNKRGSLTISVMDESTGDRISDVEITLTSLNSTIEWNNTFSFGTLPNQTYTGYTSADKVMYDIYFSNYNVLQGAEAKLNFTFNVTRGGTAGNPYVEIVKNDSIMTRVLIDQDANKQYNVTTNYTFGFSDRLRIQVDVDGDRTINITSSSLTNSTLTPVDYTVYFENLTSGATTIKVEKTGYSTRKYYASITSISVIDIDAYIAGSSDDALFNTLTTTQTPIADVNLDFERQISGTWTLIGEETTDGTGLAKVYLEPDAAYRVTASKAGYDTVQRTFSFTTSSYQIIMNQTLSIDYNASFEGLIWHFEPYQTVWMFNQSATFSFSVEDYGAQLVWFSLNVTHTNSTVTGKQLFYNITYNDVGGSINFTTPLIQYNGTITITGKISKTGYSTITLTQNYTIVSLYPQGYDLWSVIQALGNETNGVSRENGAIIMIFMIGLAVGGAGMILGRSGAIAGLILISFVGLIYPSMWTIIALMWIVLAAYYLLRERW